MKNTNGNDLEGHTYRSLQTPMKEFSRCQAAQCTKALPVRLINKDGPGAKGHDTMPAGVIPAGFINKSQMIRKHTQEGCETTQNGKQYNYPHRTRWDVLSLSPPRTAREDKASSLSPPPSFLFLLTLCVCVWGWGGQLVVCLSTHTLHEEALEQTELPPVLSNTM